MYVFVLSNFDGISLTLHKFDYEASANGIIEMPRSLITKNEFCGLSYVIKQLQIGDYQVIYDSYFRDYLMVFNELKFSPQLIKDSFISFIESTLEFNKNSRTDMEAKIEIAKYEMLFYLDSLTMTA